MEILKQCTTACLLLLATAAAAESPEDFFFRYVDLSNEFDPAVVDLYADSANIRVFRIQAQRPRDSLELAGWQWKRQLRRELPDAAAADDRNEFKNIEVSRVGRGYKIKADRYSTASCYTDRAYYVIVSEDARGRYVITEEYRVADVDSHC